MAFDPDTEEVVVSDTAGAATTLIGTVAVAIVYVLYTVLLVTVALVVPVSVAIAVGVKVTDRLYTPGVFITVPAGGS